MLSSGKMCLLPRGWLRYSLPAFLFLCLVFGNLRAVGEHYVFAHYMVCFATYGESIQAFQREIREAQAGGIDGFALDVGAWSGPDTYYKKRVQSMFDAAQSLRSNFKLFFSLEITNTTDIVQMVMDYSGHTNMFRQNGKVVLSTYGQNSVDWSNSVFQPLAKQGVGVFFVPHFWPEPVQELPSYTDGLNILNKYGGLVDGLFLFGGAGLPSQLAQCNSNYNRAVHVNGKLFMASVTPHYWGCSQLTIGRRYFEFDGGEGLQLQWRSIIANQPEWVEIVTWNDFNESTYISPVDDPGNYFAGLQTPRRYSHKGYLELSKHFITWYKTGKEPVTANDALFAFYRTHPKDALALNTNDVPVTWRMGNVQDALHASALLSSPGQLVIASGNNFTTNSLPAGLSNVKVTFSPGVQKMTLRRNNTNVVSVQGPDIQTSIQLYDFFPATAFAKTSPEAPEILRVSGQ